jgi:hypothetical protein
MLMNRAELTKRTFYRLDNRQDLGDTAVFYIPAKEDVKMFRTACDRFHKCMLIEPQNLVGVYDVNTTEDMIDEDLAAMGIE